MYFIDVQGTLISDEDKSPIRGSREFIEKLNDAKIPYMVITNNTKKDSKVFYDFLQSLGFSFAYERYLDPLMLLQRSVPKQALAAYGSVEFLEVLQKMGYELDYTDPKTVLIGIKEDFTNEEFAQMIDFLLAGAKLVGMHETSIYAKGAKRYPGVGAILKMLEFATSTHYTVIGKPSEAFYNESLKNLRMQNPQAEFEAVKMISDDVKGDLGGAKEMGMHTIFVTSGKYRTAEEILPSLAKDLRPDEVFSDMQAILEAL